MCKTTTKSIMQTYENRAEITQLNRIQYKLLVELIKYGEQNDSVV